MTFRVNESRSNYYIVKSVSKKDKKAPKIAAILPRAYASSFGVQAAIEDTEQSFQAMVVFPKTEKDSLSLPVVALKPELIALKDELASDSGRSFISLIDSVCPRKGVTLRVLDQDSECLRTVALRDLDEADRVTEAYSVGRAIRAVVNKSGRLSLKRSVIEAIDADASKRDQAALAQAIKTFSDMA